MTKVLVVGGGGREHAIVWKLAKSPCKIYCAPGNGGISRLATCVPIMPDNILGLLDFVKSQQIDLTIVGPELPLSLGIVDEFTKAGYKIFGPTKIAAQLESSKAFARQFCQKYNLPGPNYEIFDNSEAAQKYVFKKEFPLVIKVSGLAQGKGAFIVRSLNEALTTIERVLDQKMFGDSGRMIVIEDFIPGKEVSLLTLCDGNQIVPLLPVRDYKPLLDSNQGPNTGGMGSYAPIPELNSSWLGEIQENLLTRLLKALKEENIEYKGVLYLGLIISDFDKKYYILEFNARFGDPETEVILPLLKDDLLDVCYKTINGQLDSLSWYESYALTVIMASRGYPENYETGKLISGPLTDNEDTIVFHCATRRVNNDFYTAGGRVLAVTGIGKSLLAARSKAYQRVSTISFENMYYRTDIGLI
jgi:phosphoribosylamine--glycine ligase